MYRSFENYFIRFLWMGIAFIVFGQAMHMLENSFVDKKTFYSGQVTKKIGSMCVQVMNEQQKIAEYLLENQRIVFSDLNRLSGHPTYIFENDRLAYWSDNKYIPRDTLLEGEGGIRFIDLGSKKYIGIQKKIKNTPREGWIISLIPIYINYNITNDFLPTGYNSEIFINSELDISMSEKEYMPILTPEGSYLFSINFLPGYLGGNYWLSILSVTFIAAGLILILICIVLQAHKIVKKGRLVFGLGFVLIMFVILRIIMLLLQYPLDYNYISLFDSKYYASSLLNPSLGDLFINLFLVVVISVFIWVHLKHRALVSLLNKAGSIRNLVLLIALFLQYVFLFFMYKLLESLGTHSQWNLDVTTGFNFSMFRWFSYLLFVMGTLVLLFLSYAIQKVIFRTAGKDVIKMVLYSLAAFIIFISLGLLIKMNLIWVGLTGLVFLGISGLIGIKNIFVQLQYKTFVYLLVIFIISALLGAFAINDVRRLKQDVSRERFAEQLMQENDPLTEFFLQEAMEQIQDDIFIKNRLSSPFGTKEIIEEKIRRVHLNNYLDKFEIRIFLFNSRGDPLVPSRGTYFQLKDRLARDQYKTDKENIYFYNMEEREISKRYLAFIPLMRYNTNIGYIILELELKRIIPYRIYPRLLLDDWLSLQYFESQYDNALYRNGKLLNTSGNFNYGKNFDVDNLNNGRLYSSGIVVDDYRHYGFRSGNGKIYVVSSRVYTLSYFFANFSFLFIILSFVFLTGLIIYTIYFNLQGKALNYITRIQLFLNLAFFIPLIVISLTTLTKSTADYKDEIEREYLDLVESTGNNLSGYLQNFMDNISNIEELTSSINELADFSEFDMDIFSTQQRPGRLLVATQPLIYDKGILANVIDPVAFAEIRELGINSLVLDESFGKLSYKVAYGGIKSRDGSLNGILSIPFFGSQEIISRNLTGLIVNILGIFTLIFIGFIILSFIVSTYLTFPLRFVTERLRRTTLTGINEPLQYDASDEIGRLVSEYNQMLLKLEESKKALAQTEKEAAWREMAKQVAHEIKNPLTPMKLTLQHLNMRLPELKEPERSKFEKSIQSLLHNIDSLSDIATSFSDYAHMPIPEEEKFDIVKLLKETINIYINNREIEFHTDLPEEVIVVVGDPSWIGRSVSNLIINGIQAVEQGVKPVIRLSLRQTSLKRVLITVEDNGKGIRDDIRDKVFMPNFSTKYSGSGIGLAIAKRAVEHAGGKLWFDSKIGFGTSFYIELPVVS